MQRRQHSETAIFPKTFRNGHGEHLTLSRVKLVDQRVKNNIYIGLVNGALRAIKVNHSLDPGSSLKSPFIIEIETLIDLENLCRDNQVNLPIPKLHEWGYVNEAEFLGFTMTPVGQPLYLKYSLEETIDIIIELVVILRQLHAWEYVHAGIRRDNIMTFQGRVYLLDFERSAKFGCPKSGIRPEFRSPFCNHLKAHPLDDWFPLLYLALDLMENHLPWFGAMKLKKDYTDDCKKLFPKPEYEVFRKMQTYMLKNRNKVDANHLIRLLEQERQNIQSKL